MTILYNSNFDKTVPFSDTCAQFSLNQNVVETYTVPGTPINKYSVHFGYNATSNVFVRMNAAPSVPTLGSVGVEQYNEFRPGDDGFQRYAQGGDVIQMITPDTSAYVGISLRILPGG